MKYLWKDRPRLKKILSSRKRKLVLLDFDGTLSPIVKHPKDVVLSPETRKALRDLTRSSSNHVAIISGRDLDDVKSLCRLKKIVYVGNHGLEINLRGVKLTKKLKSARKIKTKIGFLAKRLQEEFKSFPGVLIENKTYSLSLHFRNLPKGDLSSFNNRFKRFKKEFSHFPIFWRKGKKVWEAIPLVHWGKGDAAIFLLRHFKNALPIAIGDDKTDEEMFAAINPYGVTIRVGASDKSVANFYLRSSIEVNRFLGELCKYG